MSETPCRMPVGANEVSRSRVLSYLERTCPRAVLVTAPSGYGKTVLATQIARLPRFAERVWVGCSGHEVLAEVLLAEVVDSARAALSGASDSETGPRAELPDIADALADLARTLAVHTGPVCIVIDDVLLHSLSHEVSELAALVARSAHDHALVVTAREVPSGQVARFRGFVAIDVDDLALDEAEVEALVLAVAPDVCAASLSQEAFELSGGQAALASVLASHAAMRGGGITGAECSLDLTGLLVSLADTQFAGAETEALVAISLLGYATSPELVAVDEAYREVDLVRMSRCIPLLRPVTDGAGTTSFHMHDIACDVYGSRGFVERLGPERLRALRAACMGVLESRRDYPRLVPLLVEHLTEGELAAWLLANGERIVSSGRGLDLARALEVLPSTLLLSHPRLLLMSAEYGPVASDSAERMERASVARTLAECEGDWATAADALLATANAAKDLGKVHEACEALEELLGLPEAALSRERRLISAAHLVTAAVIMFDMEKADKLRVMLEGALAEGGLRDAILARIYAQLGAARCFSGQTHEGARMLIKASEIEQAPLALRALVLGNLAVCLNESGRLAHARKMLQRQKAVAEGFGLEPYRVDGDGIGARLHFLSVSETAGLDLFAEAIEGYQTVGDRASESYSRAERAMLLRSVGDIDGAMSDVEAALEYAMSEDIAYIRHMAEVELAANFLALGDLEAAARHARDVREICAAKDALQQVLRAEMVLAEVARRRGSTQEAVEHLRVHKDYILQENANFPIAMYIRAFPALLGLLASALGPERLPAYMLRMVPDRYAENALIAARGILADDEWRVLASRLPAPDGSPRTDLATQTPSCRVRLFGAFQVTVGDREVSEQDWCKRKSRLLFAMLVLQQGRDLSRESVYEHLWPDMNEARARNNLYVTWSAMKAALMPNAPRDVPCPYATHKGGVCRISTALVSSDTARFDELLAEGRAAEAEGDDQRALTAFERLVDVYRGELLPGDVYEDWFSSARDRYRQEFGDAMVTAHRLLSEKGEHAAALRMVRRGIAADSWREDLYQSALASQIALGQRGAAVATYLACRSTLAEELGLDPSRETVRLYEEILAMEDGPERLDLD